MYEGEKINFIKDVRGATGCSLVQAKLAVDLCIADGVYNQFKTASTVGDVDDFIKTVRFVVDFAEEFGGFESYQLREATDDAKLAVNVIAGNQAKTFSPVGFCLDYWKKE